MRIHQIWIKQIHRVWGITRIPIYVGEHGICFESQIQGVTVGFFWQNQLRPENLAEVNLS
jgi:hypothetical protein